MSFDLHTSMSAAKEIDALLSNIDEDSAWEILCLEQMHRLGLKMVIDLIKARIAVNRFYEAGLNDENYEEMRESYRNAVETIMRYRSDAEHPVPPMIEHPADVRKRYIRQLRLNRYLEPVQEALDAYLDEGRKTMLPQRPENADAKALLRQLFQER